MNRQVQAFLAGEGDAYARRNPSAVGLEQGLLERIAMYLRPGSRVLEVGCGSGANLRTLDNLVAGLSCHGCDPSAEAIAHAKSVSPHHNLDVATSDALPYRSTFDLVLMSFVLHWVDRELLMRTVAEVDRVLCDADETGTNPGFLAIADFDARAPHRQRYRHREGLWTSKMDYAALWGANPSYTTLERFTWSTTVERRSSEMGHEFEDEHRSIVILGKDHTAGFPLRNT